jgi:hypothetical protein
MATKTRITVYDNDLRGDPYYDPTFGMFTCQLKGDRLNECLGFLGGRKRGTDARHNAAEAARLAAIEIAKQKTGSISKRAAAVRKDRRMPERTGRKPGPYSHRQIRRWLTDQKKSGQSF